MSSKISIWNAVVLSVVAPGCFLSLDTTPNVGLDPQTIALWYDGGPRIVRDSGPPPGDGGITASPQVWVANSTPGSSGITLIDVDTDTVTPLPFSSVSGASSVTGAATGVVVQGTQGMVSLSSPASVAIVDLQHKQLIGHVSIGGASDTASDITTDGLAAYVVNQTASSIAQVQISPTVLEHTATSSDIIGMASPEGIAATSQGELVIGSSSSSVTSLLFAAGVDAMTGWSFSQENAKTTPLTAKPATGTAGRCIWLKSETEGFCAGAGGFSESDGGTTAGALWHFTPGGSATKVADLPDAPLDLATDAQEQSLFISSDASVMFYWIAGATKTAPVFILRASQPAGTHSVAAVGGFVLVTNPSANKVTKLSAADLSVIHTYTGVSGATGISVVH